MQKACTKGRYSEDELLTKHKYVIIQRGHTENHARAAEKSRKWRGEVAVYVLYMCVSQDTLCAVCSTIKHVRNTTQILQNRIRHRDTHRLERKES